MVRICVADGGPGIPPEERRKLFKMFSKLSTRPTGGETSTGLGLWIVKELTQLQGGRVGVDQRGGGGSLFWVELPLRAGRVEAEAVGFVADQHAAADSAAGRPPTTDRPPPRPR